MVDAVVGGDFVFPQGVEPVSAAYIISIASKLRQPSLLKMQHCVALDKAGTDNQLSFYRSGLKEPTSPYFFKRIKGGKFDINNQYGELELPVFCAMVIGKESTTSSDSLVILLMILLRLAVELLVILIHNKTLRINPQVSCYNNYYCSVLFSIVKYL